MKILLTGGTGFIGGHLLRALKERGDAVDLLVRDGSALPATGPPAVGELHAHDGTTEGLMRILEASRPDLVIHLAALFVVQHEAADVRRLLESNVLLTAQLAEAMARAGVSRLINTGTAWQHFEDRAYSPVSLYAASKQAAEALLQYYVETAGLRVLTLKLFNTYGPGDRRQKLFVLLRQASQRAEPLAMSPGEQRLDLVHVDDVVGAFLVATQRLAAEPSAPSGGGGGAGRAESYAVRSGQPLTLREVVAVYAQATGRRPNVRWGGLPYRPREVMAPWSGGATLPGWSARVSLADGIRRLAESGDV
jgi:nucleoside-diphosphate-sugar epimerase